MSFGTALWTGPTATPPLKGRGLKEEPMSDLNTTAPRRARRAALTLTPAAEARVAKLMARAPEGTVGVKLSTPRRGCSGLAYSVDYVSEPNPLDERIDTPAGPFFVDGASILYLIGSTMDWSEDDFTAGFVFENPNAKGQCGCGESFTV